jgi:hypothetical protein
MTHLVSETPKNVKADLARQLVEAARAADAYAGPDPVARFRAHSDFDFPDVMTGELLHDPECPFCRLRKLKRAYGLACHVGRMSS